MFKLFSLCSEAISKCGPYISVWDSVLHSMCVCFTFVNCFPPPPCMHIPSTAGLKLCPHFVQLLTSGEARISTSVQPNSPYVKTTQHLIYLTNLWQSSNSILISSVVSYTWVAVVIFTQPILHYVSNSLPFFLSQNYTECE